MYGLRHRSKHRQGLSQQKGCRSAKRLDGCNTMIISDAAGGALLWYDNQMEMIFKLQILSDDENNRYSFKMFIIPRESRTEEGRKAIPMRSLQQHGHSETHSPSQLNYFDTSTFLCNPIPISPLCTPELRRANYDLG